MARVQTRGVTTRSKKPVRWRTELETSFTARITAPRDARAYIRKIIRPFSSSISTLSTSQDDGGTRILLLSLSPSSSFLHCVSRLPRALLAFYPSGRERGGEIDPG